VCFSVGFHPREVGTEAQDRKAGDAVAQRPTTLLDYRSTPSTKSWGTAKTPSPSSLSDDGAFALPPHLKVGKNRHSAMTMTKKWSFVIVCHVTVIVSWFRDAGFFGLGAIFLDFVVVP
jgi:hypothetical protein